MAMLIFLTFITPAFRVFLLLSILKCVVPFNAYWLYKTIFPSKKRSYWPQTLNSSVCICLSLSIRCHQAVWDLDASWQRTSVLRVWNYYHAIQACFQNSVWQSIWIQTHYLSHTHIRKAPKPRFYFQHMYQSRHCLNINTWEMRKKLIWNMYRLIRADLYKIVHLIRVEQKERDDLWYIIYSISVNIYLFCSLDRQVTDFFIISHSLSLHIDLNFPRSLCQGASCGHQRAFTPQRRSEQIKVRGEKVRKESDFYWARRCSRRLNVSRCAGSPMSVAALLSVHIRMEQHS